jgi:hypothetical protein
VSEFSSSNICDIYLHLIAVDNSDSMVFEEKGTRRETLEKVLSNVAKIYTYARKEGIVAIRLLNHEKKAKNITEAKVKKLMPMIQYDGISMIGTQLEAKILKPYIYEKAQLEKPLLVVTITDGDVRTDGYP